MKIAVNTRFLLSDQLEGYGYYLYECFSRLTRNHPQHEFIFIFDRPYDKRFIFGSNVKAVVTGPSARHPVLWKLWYDIKVPAVLKKHKADVFVSCDGFCSLTTSVAQCLVIHDLAFLHYPHFIPRSHFLFYKYYTPKFIEKARHVITVSQFSKNDIITQYKTHEAKITIVPNGAKAIFQRLTDDDKQKVKDRYTDGKDFFLYTGAIHPRKNLLNLVKAFSVFKRKQKSNWKLVLAGRLAWKYKPFVKSLETYKYREDLILTSYLEEKELADLTASAYAMVYPSFWEGFGVPVLEAMQSGIPVITSDASAMKEIAGDAALYVKPEDQNDIADKMMRLYKDERLRSELVSKGLARSKDFNWDRSAELFWEAIRNTAVSPV
jgi:glycosyltransferase involved in cell wall biosynthesis